MPDNTANFNDMVIEVLNEVDAIFNELNESIEINYAVDESRGRKARMSVLRPDKQLTAEEEKNERFAEAVAKKFGLAYFPESCIAGANEQLALLKKARDIISKRMDVGPIKDEKYHDVYKKKFVFYS